MKKYIWIGVSSAFVLFSLGMYLYAQIRIGYVYAQITRLQKEIENVQKINEDVQKEIAAHTSLQQAKKIALEQGYVQLYATKKIDSAKTRLAIRL